MSGIPGWIDLEDYDVNCILRMERFQTRMMPENLDQKERRTAAGRTR